jgi:hypothetical protein
VKSVAITCGVQGTGCSKSFMKSYDERLTPFYQEPRGPEWPTDRCPHCRKLFRFARLFKDPWKVGLVTVFE